jgi:hypothetical protein
MGWNSRYNSVEQEIGMPGIGAANRVLASVE